MSTLVMKFGGSSVATPEGFSRIAELVAEKRKEHSRIVVVVSAMGDTTNQLISLARQVHPDPPRREHDMLVSVGERVSIALLAMSLSKREIEAVSFTGSQSGIITTTDHSDAKITEVRPQRLIRALEKGCVVIVAGFQGVSTEGEITTLGRGGSDTTAVALAVSLQASHVVFYKDVPGIFCSDPKTNQAATPFTTLAYQEALKLAANGARVLSERSLILAEKNRLPLVVTSYLEGVEGETWIGFSDEKCSLNPVYEKSVLNQFRNFRF